MGISRKEYNKKDKNTICSTDSITGSRYDGRINNDNVINDGNDVLKCYEKLFVRRKPCCQNLPGNTIVCREMDIFELYLCVILINLKMTNRKPIDIQWKSIDAGNGEQLWYPSNDKIWNIITNEFEKIICCYDEEINNTPHFFTKLRRCEVKDENGYNDAGVNQAKDIPLELCLVFYINKEPARINRYMYLITFICICFKNVFDLFVENECKCPDLKKSIDDFMKSYNNEIFGDEISKGLHDIKQKYMKKYSDIGININQSDYQSTNWNSFVDMQFIDMEWDKRR